MIPFHSRHSWTKRGARQTARIDLQVISPQATTKPHTAHELETHRNTRCRPAKSHAASIERTVLAAFYATVTVCISTEHA